MNGILIGISLMGILIGGILMTDGFVEFYKATYPEEGKLGFRGIVLGVFMMSVFIIVLGVLLRMMGVIE